MQFIVAVELAVMALLAIKFGIRNIERELERKPIRYEEKD
jgi:hypothetical protein